jgi:hypothetical protein
VEKIKITDVFTPTTPAKYAFVERQGLNDQLVEALMTPGKQVVVYGPRGGRARRYDAREPDSPGTGHWRSVVTEERRVRIFIMLAPVGGNQAVVTGNREKPRISGSE